jgi:hypothetical protein
MNSALSAKIRCGVRENSLRGPCGARKNSLRAMVILMKNLGIPAGYDWTQRKFPCPQGIYLPAGTE